MSGELTKEEAIQAMKEGKRVAHRFFDDHEWITIKDDRIFCEDSFSYTHEDFWLNRDSQEWGKGWRIVENEHDEGREEKPKGSYTTAEFIGRVFEKQSEGVQELREQLAKERELRKELVASVEDLIGRESFKLNYPRTAEKLEALIKKGT